MQRFIYILLVLILIIGIALTTYSPDTISAVFIASMEIILLLGALFGVIPVTLYNRGLLTGLKNIAQASNVPSESAWTVISQSEELFHQGRMDRLFRSYREKVKIQQESGQIMADVDEYINEDTFSVLSWQNVVAQIPGTLTGLGILGTFIGLIVGIRGIGFSSVDAALSSVQTLLAGIQIAFYTSIAGVILSLLFNITYRISWNILMRNMTLFVDEFHKNVIPSAEEQERYRKRKDIKQILEMLDRIPKGNNFSVANGSYSGPGQPGIGNEQILMPQILQGLKDKEFIFIIQPIYELFSRKIVGGEALVRWKHAKLGMVSPSVFIPVLEHNGYITKLDQYIWEQVCATVRKWIDDGIRPVPISVNVTKTDILAIDIVSFFETMIKKYRIPPQSLVIEIAENAYLQLPQVILDVEANLRHSGFRVVIDGFNGDYLPLNSVGGLSADGLKLDLRSVSGSSSLNAMTEIFEKGKQQQFTVSVEGIESMEQLAILRKCGCTTGQGFYLSKPCSVDDFEETMRE